MLQDLKSWISKESSKEHTRLASHGITIPLVLNTKNCSLVCDLIDKEYWVATNRVELDTPRTWGKVKQILTGPEIVCPFKADLVLFHVLLFEEGMEGQERMEGEEGIPTAYFPYLLDRTFKFKGGKRVVNRLTEWCLINSLGERINFSVVRTG